ncbi:hypothetical protein QS257_15965 [Terrilactibacillus sp. S3-3]|nr:hypothetical protein QS257_15965 [Terrilactibacillus sp. S3-3]
MKGNNYGQEPKDDNNNFKSYTLSVKSAKSFSVHAGDIFVTNATSSSYFLGHCGIAVSSKSIVDLPGKGRSVKIKTNNNRKLPVSKWVKKYKGG